MSNKILVTLSTGEQVISNSNSDNQALRDKIFNFLKTSSIFTTESMFRDICLYTNDVLTAICIELNIEL